MTAIGEQVIAQARRVLVEWESIKTLVDASRGLHAGRIKLATFPSVFTSLPPSFLQSFGQQYPGINVATLDGTALSCARNRRGRPVSTSSKDPTS